MAKKDEKKETAIRTVLVDGKDTGRIKRANEAKQFLANQLAQIQVALKAQDEAINLILGDYVNDGEVGVNFDVDSAIFTVRKQSK